MDSGQLKKSLSDKNNSLFFIPDFFYDIRYPNCGTGFFHYLFIRLSPSLLWESLPRLGGGFGERHKKTGGILTE